MPPLDPDSERRIRELEEQIENRPNARNDLMAEIGVIYLDAGQPVEALSAWRDAPWARVFDDRQVGSYLGRRAEEFERRGHLRAAVDSFERAVRDGRAPGEVAYELTLAFVFALGLFLRAGWTRDEVDERLAQAREKLDANPRFTAMWFQLGMSHTFRGEFSPALRAFRSFHRLSSLRQDRELQIEALIELVGTATERTAGAPAQGEWPLPGLDAARRAPWPQALDGLRALGLDDDEARAWVREGFDAKSSTSWRRAGVDARSAKLYGVKGFDPEVTQALRERGLSPSARVPIRGREQLRAWEDAGLSLDDALDADGLEIEDVSRWRGAGFALPEVKPWLREAIEPEVAGAWRAAGIDLAEARTWARAGIRPDGVEAWQERSIRAPAAARWLAAAFTPEQARQWLDAGIQEAEANGWRELGAGPEDALPWRRRGFQPADRTEWSGAGFELEEAYAWRSRGFEVADASAERDRGLTPEEAVERWRFEGLVPYEPQGHKALLFWGLVFTASDRLPWGDDGPELYHDQWRERFERLAPADVAVEDLGCAIDAYGKPASLGTYYACVRESVVEALDGRPRRFDEPRVLGGWDDRLRRFCDIMRIPFEEVPTWWLTATIWE